MNKAFLSALPLGFLLSLSIQKPSHAQLRVCNRDTHPRGINVAVAFHDSIPPYKAYFAPVVKGWFRVKPNDCKLVLNTGENVKNHVYLYAMTSDRKKTWSGDAYFCVNDNRQFTIVSRPTNIKPSYKHDLENCFKQAGNTFLRFRHFEVNKNGDTINLSSSVQASGARCDHHIKVNKVLNWATYDASALHNKGYIVIENLQPNGKWSGTQVLGSNQEYVSGEISGSTFTMFNPRWTETWTGVCNREEISGIIERTGDNKNFTFLFRPK